MVNYRAVFAEFLAMVNYRAVLAEFLAMLLFVYIGAGSATGVFGTPGWVQQVSLTFGFCITVMAYTIGHHSYAHINCAVTFGLVVARECPLGQGIANFIAQMFGSLAGAALLALTVPKNADLTGQLGTNTVNPDFHSFQALVGEVLMTFLLMYVVLETAVNPKTEGNRMMAAVAIGLAVYLAHSIMIPIDGCSINPTRSFGPPVVASIRYSDDSSKKKDLWEDHWVFWLGPLVGSVLAVGVYKLMDKIPGDSSENKSGD